MPAPGTPSDRGDPLVTVVRCTVVHAGCTSLRRLKAATYALRACSRALLVGLMPELASGSRVAAGDGHWLLMAVRGHLGDTFHRLGDGRYDRALVLDLAWGTTLNCQLGNLNETGRRRV
jgi:hypothetical protein